VMPRRVLLIEDEPRIAEFVAKALRRDGNDVVLAEDGGVGLFLAGTEPYDAVVLDLALPDTPGLEVLQEIRTAYPDVPIVVLTGHDDPASRRACLAAGASCFVPKPLVVEEFRVTVSALLSGRPAD
jgi:two-component system OmpR family response regulator